MFGRPAQAVQPKPRTPMEKIKMIYQDENIWNVVKSIAFFAVAVKFTREFHGVELIH
ncbi:Uncharacterized protein FWK35_00021189 [Aphis craccivora]|uniref:Uncharacterized protein n=1 Tax=Aphis craccivora TaxID=307492 RepID=A0A6G0Y4C0_APHCR|nr:Uncharacterized protein FWK35_00021189 [Aphis craccivora]